MREQVYAWLVRYLSSEEENSKDKKMTPKDIQQLLKNENATLFLMIWSIMEQKIFDGFMKKKDIDMAAECFTGYYQELDINDIFLHFHRRYQNKETCQHLKHGDKNGKFDEILKMQEDKIADKEKMTFLFYVVYRYRNNIFHGNKGIESWSQFTEQITYCIQFMTKIIDYWPINKGEC